MSGDASYSNVSALLHFDGANGSTTFTDSGPNAVAFTRAGNAQISTAQSVFGGASGLFDGTGDYITTPGTAAFVFGTGDFSIEFRIRTTDNNCVPVDFYGGNGWQVYIDGSGFLQWYTSSPIKTTSSAINNGVWHDIAICRASGMLSIYVDGVASGSAVSHTQNLSTTNTYLAVGGQVSTRSPGYDFSGNIDELRVTKGVARRTANYTPETTAFANSAVTAVQGYASAASPLGAALVLSAAALVARASAATPLGGALALGVFGTAVRSAYGAAPSPLAAPAALARQPVSSALSAPGPLGAVSAVARAVSFGLVRAAGPLGSALVLARLPVTGHASAPSALGACAVLAVHDFTGQLGDAVTLFVMDLITPTGAVRIPISSWQATLQTGSSNYVQCVIPACTMWVSAINSATEFVISRRAVLPNGTAVEYEMARAPATTPQFDRGPQRHTCTLSGYTDAFAESEDPPAVYDRALTGIRSISSGSSYRVRCAVDWLLRPGHRAFVEDAPFVVAYINYYAPSEFDCYMDVGD